MDAARTAARDYELALERDAYAHGEVAFEHTDSPEFEKKAERRAEQDYRFKAVTLVKAIVEADEALMAPGLALEDRIWRLRQVSLLYASLLGDGLLSTQGAPKAFVGGFAVSVFKGYATNAAAATQILGARSPSQEARLPDPKKIMLRAVMENDDLECGFSAAAANAGGTKLGSCEDFRRVGVVAEQQAQEKRRGDRGYAMRYKRKSPYEHADFSRRQIERWNDPSCYEEELAARWKRFRRSLRHALPKNTVRSHHKR